MLGISFVGCSHLCSLGVDILRQRLEVLVVDQLLVMSCMVNKVHLVDKTSIFPESQ